MTIRVGESREEYNLRCREHYAKNPEKLRARAFRYWESNKEQVRQRHREIRAKIREQFFTIYGAKCACCGETEPAFLNLSHINGDGGQERKQLGNRNVYKKAIDYPDHSRYETLCFNCNMAAKLYGQCPHKGARN